MRMPARDEIGFEFRFPSAFIEYTETADEDLYPWQIIIGDPKRFSLWIENFRQKFPKLKLVPFAHFIASDDVACFDGTNNPLVAKIRILDYTFPADLTTDEYIADFETWLERARREAANWAD